MTDTSSTATWRRSVLEYAVALALCLAALSCVMRLWKVDWTVPFCYCDDGLLTGTLIKGVIENPWYLHNPYLGVPGGRDHHDFPIADSLHLVALKLIGRLTGDFALTHNLYFLLTFPLTMLAALFVLRRFSVGYGPAVVASVLYSFLPYAVGHAALGHLFLAAAYLVPLMVLVVLWVYLDREVLVCPDPQTGRLRWHLLRRRTLGAILICLLVSSAGVYYAFFGCFLLMTAGLAAALSRRRRYPLGNAAVLAVVLSLGVAVNLAPSWVYRHRHGANPHAVTRRARDAETYALKIAQMLLPAPGHRVTAFNRLREHYDVQAPLVNENSWSSLGLVAGAGFVLLCGRILVRRADAKGLRVQDGLTTLTLASLTLATVGGFGSLFSFLGIEWIRCYARVSIFLAFFALFAVALLLDKAARHLRRSRRARLAFAAGLAVLAVAGVLDQTSWRWRPPFNWASGSAAANLAEAFRHDAAWVRRVEDSLPPHAWVFQLPYVPYPEHAPVERMGNYDHFRGYLHSRTLHWSYGTMKGRGYDGWQRDRAALPPEEMVPALVYAGFQGITLDRNGYADRGVALETKLTAVTGTPPFVSANGHITFFNLTGTIARLKRGCTEEEWQERCEAACHPVLCEWRTGFYDRDELGTRWCTSRGELHVINTGTGARTVTLTLACISPQDRPANLSIKGALFSAELRINGEHPDFVTTVTVPPGRHVIRFRCDGPQIVGPGDPRFLIFNVARFSARDTADAAPPTPVAKR